jgi:hypothetical protein
MFWSLVIMAIIAVTGDLNFGVNQVDEGVDAWEKAIKSVVEDKSRKKEFETEFKKTRAEIAERRTLLSKAMAAFLKVESRYDATQDDEEKAIHELNDVWTEQERWLMNKRFEMQEMLTPEEWQTALKQVDEALSEHWDVLKESQTNARERYLKLLEKTKD